MAWLPLEAVGRPVVDRIPATATRAAGVGHVVEKAQVAAVDVGRVDVQPAADGRATAVLALAAQRPVPRKGDVLQDAHRARWHAVEGHSAARGRAAVGLAGVAAHGPVGLKGQVPQGDRGVGGIQAAAIGANDPVLPVAGS